jgi:fatty acid desaturase
MRDYTVGGPSAAVARERGLVDADWFKPKVDREVMRQLMQRNNLWASLHVGSWFAALGLAGWWGHQAWGTWWAIPAFAVYGTLYGSMSDSRWHECGHRTAFRSKWMNDVVYYIASFMIFREPESWRWSHARHHSDTIIVGRDNEISFKRNVPPYRYVLEMVGITGVPAEFMKLVRNARGVFPADQRDYQPEETLNTSKWASRAYLAVIVSVIGLAVALRSFEPLMYAVLPSFYGRTYLILLGITQHAGLAEDVTDHRLNTRTIYMNPLNRWIYWNMNYHLEHHMFPSVPFHQLKRLHETVKHELPVPYPSLWSALKEIVPALRKQATDDAYFVKRAVPTAGA